jgi:hypothetical protein
MADCAAFLPFAHICLILIPACSPVTPRRDLLPGHELIVVRLL